MATETTSADGKTGEGVKPDATTTTTTTDPKAAAKGAEGAGSGDITLKFPEGFKADDALVGKLQPLFKKHGLDSAKAQELVDAYAGHQAELSKASEKDAEKAFVDLKAGFLKDLKADKEIGGAKFDASVAAATKAIAKFGTPALQKFFDDTGMGNHPEVVRAFAKVGAAMAEDSIGSARGDGPPVPDKNEALWALYPSMRPKTA